MLGIAVELIISWVLLWFTRKEHLGALGLRPTSPRLINFMIGLFIAASCCIIYQLMNTAFANNSWQLNPKLAPAKILEGSRYTIISVLYEELIFRGALLYIAIRKIGITKACLLSAVCFGIYHWFTFNVLGNPFMMLITFLMTAIVGLSWAYAFAKTGSMYLPVGLHLGWNYIQTIVLANGSPARQIFTRSNENKPEGVVSLLLFLFQVFALPFFTFLYLRWIERKQQNMLKDTILSAPGRERLI